METVLETKMETIMEPVPTLFWEMVAALCPEALEGAPDEALITTPEGPSLALGAGRLVFTESALILDGGVEDGAMDDAAVLSAIEPLIPAGTALFRLHRLLCALPAEAPTEAGGRRGLHLMAPAGAPVIDGAGRVTLRVALMEHDADDALLDIQTAEGPIFTLEQLGVEGPDPLEAWRALAAAVAAEGSGFGQLDRLFPDPDGDGPDLSALGLGARLEALGLIEDDAWPASEVQIDALHARFAAAEERFAAGFGLRLPLGLLALAALTEALGALPEDPPGAWAEGAPGWSRGRQWLDHGLGLRPAGLTDWLAPGGLDRPTRDPGPEGAGPLDPRLDWRFRRDPPQFITFAVGDSDGSHWGLWYDHPEAGPEVAHNWARDSAETSREAASVPALLDRRIADEAEARAADQAEAPDEHTEAALVATLVVQAVWARTRPLLPTREEPACPWPLSARGPTGSPPLRLPAGAGPLPQSVPGIGVHDDPPSPAAIAAGVQSARAALSAGQPAAALGWGMYLHWLDEDPPRPEAGPLLADALRALDCAPLAALLEVHLQHRDLASVAVYVEPDEG